MFNVFKKVRKLFADKYWRAKQEYLNYYEKLPLDEKAILLESEHGRKLDGNIFYLIRYLARSDKYKDHRLYLCALGRNVAKFKEFLESHGIFGVNIVMLASEEYIKLLASAKYLINDTSFPPYYIKKDGQVYLNTWHGTPLKTLGKSDASEYHSIGNIQRNFLMSDYLLYPNEYTRDIMLRDYMLYNIAASRVVLSGYPRNEIFFDSSAKDEVRKNEQLEGKRVYVYMPTYRGEVRRGKTSTSTAYLIYHLCEIEKRLSEDEVLYVNLHPLASDGVDFRAFNRIKKFPAGYEVYEFLSCADVLITDYSSVFFDFAVSGRKTVLFTYDEREYLASRGMYMDIADLPFPHVYDVDSLVRELRAPKEYDDTEFLKTFCSYESPYASERLCDAVILGEPTISEIEPVPSNGKENVAIYAGNLASNGITVSLLSLLRTIDITKRNYFVTFKTENVAKNKEVLKQLPEGIEYIAMTGDINVTIKDRIIRKLFKKKIISAGRYMKRCKDHIKLALCKQHLGDARLDALIQFNGYENETMLEMSTFDGINVIFVHNDNVQEIKVKGNQRWDTLKYAYNAYDKVAVVTEDLIPPTSKISGTTKNIVVIKNTINHRRIAELGSLELDEADYERCTVDFDTLREALNSTDKKFINIGRFAPEKGHDRLVRAFAEYHRDDPDSYLFIMGGYSLSGYYEKLIEQVSSLGLSDRVILIYKTPNPYRILAKCDYFVLSSHYEGFGLVLAESDILGKPVISTDITGPRLFMQKHGGTLVENSEAGLLEGMRLLSAGKVGTLGVDYEEYNAEIVREFDKILSK